MASDTQNVTNDQRKSTFSHIVQTAGKDVKPLQAFFSKFGNDWSMTFSSSLAFSLLTAMLPIAIAIFGILGLILGSNSSLTQTITSKLGSIAPNAATSQAIELALRQLNKNAGFLLIIAILLAIFGGSRLFISMENILDIVYRVRPRKFLRQNLMAFAMLLLFVVLVPLMVFASAAPVFILGLLSNNPALKSIPFFSAVAGSPVIYYLATIVGSLIVGFILFEAIYFVVPNQRISWRNSWPGALVAAAALNLFLFLFPLYIRYSLSNYTGQIGFAVILLLFFYYFAVIIMLGAEVNAFFRERVHPLPDNLATFVSTMGGKLNQDLSSAESESHVDAKATEIADRGHVARAREKEEQIRHEKEQQQQQIATKALAQDKTDGKKKARAKRSSRLPATLQVVAGSALAFVVEWLRLRRRAQQ